MSTQCFYSPFFSFFSYLLQCDAPYNLYIPYYYVKECRMYSQWKYSVIYTSSLLNDVYHPLNPETFITLRVYFCLLDNMKITSERAGAHKKSNRSTRTFHEETRWIVYQLIEHVKSNILVLNSQDFLWDYTAQCYFGGFE